MTTDKELADALRITARTVLDDVFLSATARAAMLSKADEFDPPSPRYRVIVELLGPSGPEALGGFALSDEHVTWARRNHDGESIGALVGAIIVNAEPS